MKKKYIVIAVACIGLAGIFGNSNDSTQPKQETIKVETASAVSEKPAKTAKPMTAQQRALKNEDKDAPADGVNALKKGILYVESMHMSKAGVYDQLVSEHGEKFSPEAARWGGRSHVGHRLEQGRSRKSEVLPEEYEHEPRSDP